MRRFAHYIHRRKGDSTSSFSCEPSVIDARTQIWTCGVNDDAALGRITQDVPDPNNPGSFISVDDLTAVPHPLQSLIDEGFRAVTAVAGDSICAAVSDKGDLRVWGSFRVCLSDLTIV